MPLAAGRDVSLWVREEEVLESIRSAQKNPFLPGVTLPETIHATGDLEEAAKAEVLLLAVPAQLLGSFCRQTRAAHACPNTPLVICAKGIEKGTGLLIHEMVAKSAPEAAIAILSGPSFAREVALGLPTAVTIAANGELAARLQQSLSTPVFRPYASDDVVGVALGGQRPRMSTPLPVAWSKAWAWARMPAPRSWPAASPNWRGSAWRWAPNAKPWKAFPAWATWS